jgi:SSS family solute:Na+ symporter
MIAAVALIPFVVMPAIIGMYGKALFPDAPTASILFKVVLSDMNPIVAGLMIAAVLSAVMSTMDIGLLNVTANAVNDIYYKTLNPNADEKKLGRLSMIVTITSGVIALVLAISSSSILSLLSSTYSLMNAGALVMVLGGIFWKKGTKEGAIASALCGMAMIILNKCGVEIPYIAFTSLVPALIAYIVVSLVTQPKGIKAE